MRKLGLLLFVAVLVFAVVCFSPVEVYAEVPDAPKNLTVQKNAENVLYLDWSSVDCASYNVYMGNQSIGVEITETRFSLSGIITEGGTYTFAVSAVGADGVESLQTTVTYDHYIELEAPATLNVSEEKILSWTDSNPDDTQYTVVINGIAVATDINGRSFDLSDKLTLGIDYDIRVQAQKTDYYTASKFSQRYTYENSITLDAPLSAAVAATENGLGLSWTKVLFADGYKVVITDSSSSIMLEEDCTENTLDITEYVTEPDNYTIKINATSTDTRILTSEDLSIVFEKTITLNTPTLRASSNILSWEAVENAAYYIVSINGVTVENELCDTSYDYSSDITSAGEYTISVQAVGVGNYTPSSVATYKHSTYIQLDTPVVIIENGILSWNAVQNAQTYTVKANGNIINNVYNLTEIDLSQYFAVAANYTISVAANAVGFYTESDTATVTYSVYAELAAPLVDLDGTTLYWQAVDGAVGYTILVDGASVATSLSATEYDLSAYLTGSSHTVGIFAEANGNYTVSPTTEIVYGTPQAGVSYKITKNGGEVLSVVSKEYTIYVMDENYECCATDLTFNNEGYLVGDDLESVEKHYIFIVQTVTEQNETVYGYGLVRLNAPEIEITEYKDKSVNYKNSYQTTELVPNQLYESSVTPNDGITYKIYTVSDGNGEMFIIDGTVLTTIVYPIK